MRFFQRQAGGVSIEFTGDAARLIDSSGAAVTDWTSGAIGGVTEGIYTLEVRVGDDIHTEQVGVGMVVLALGQSNMNLWFHRQTTISAENVWQWNRDGDGWFDANGAGAAQFGKLLAEQLGIPVAVHGAAFKGALTPEAGLHSFYLDQSETSPYTKAMEQFALAGGQAELVLWSQGEADARAGVSGDTYLDGLNQLFDRIQADLGPVDIGIIELGRSTRFTDPSWDEIRQAQRDVATDRDDTTILAETLSLQLTWDGVHLNNPSYAAAARLAAVTFLEAQGILVNDTGIQSGDEFANDLHGSTDHDILFGRAGADTLSGHDGDDAISGGDDDDSLIGGFGNDDLWGDFGNDILFAGPGNDVLHGAAQADRLHGGVGRDTLWGEHGHDTLVGHTGDDLLFGGWGEDRLSGGAGNDTLRGEGHADWIAGLAGADKLYGGPDGDLLLGGDGTDRLFGGAGNDTLAGHDGDDRLDGGRGADRLVGGVGDDTYIVDQDGDQVVELANGGLDLVRASLSHGLSMDVEALRLTGAGDLQGWGNGLDNQLTGNGGANLLTGRLGDDTLAGGQGDDTLLGDQGNDHLDGGAGADRMAGGGGDDSYIANQAGDLVVELFGRGVDQVLSAFDHNLAANVEHLTLAGSADRDGRGNDLANRIAGNSGNNGVRGLGGNDTLAGGLGDDLLIGDAGDDVILGDGGDDTLLGGTGADVLAGGDGDDAFVFAGTFGSDRITDFSAGAASGDQLDFARLGIEFADLTIAAAGADTWITLGHHGAVLLEGVTPAELDLADDFAF